MLAAGEELFTCWSTSRYWICAVFPLGGKQGINLFSATRTELDSRRHFLTGLTKAFMADFLALMLATVQSSSTDFLAHESSSAAFHKSLLFAAEAFLSDIYLAFGTGSWMTNLITLMNTTVEELRALIVVATVLRSLRQGTRNSSLVLATIAFNGNVNAAWRTTTRMADNVTFAMRAMVTSFLVTVLSAWMREQQWREGWLIIPPAEAEITRHWVLSVAEVTVRTRPSEESQELFCSFLSLGFIFFITDVIPLLSWLLMLFFLLILVVKFTNPSFNTAKMEGLVTLLTVP